MAALCDAWNNLRADVGRVASLSSSPWIIEAVQDMETANKQIAQFVIRPMPLALSLRSRERAANPSDRHRKCMHISGA